MAERIKSIDIAKGIGISLVVFFHCNLGQQLYDLHILVYSFHMPLFFILAGMCFSTRYSFAEFTLKRTKRLIIPCVLFTLINVIISCCLHPKTYWNDVILILPEHVPGALWFLNILFISELICYPIIIYVKRRRAKILISLFIGAIGIMVSSINFHLPQSIGSVPLACFYILFGYMIKPYNKIWDNFKCITLLILFLLWTFFTLHFQINVHLYDGMSEPRGLSEFASIIGSILCIAFSTRLVNTKIGALFKKVGGGEPADNGDTSDIHRIF